MLDEIQHRDAQLIEQHGHLEQVVDQRTAELRSTNEDLTLARDKAMEASRAKSEFLANMSHEIRTPMNGIVGMTELSLDSTADEQLRDYLLTVRSSAASLLTILDDILDFSKIESRKLELELVPVSVRDLIRQPIRPMAVTAEAKGLELLCDITPDVPQGIAGDPGRIRQVITNLIGNAIKFTARGHVLLTVREVSREAQVSSLQFSISDTGIGIPADKLETIFEPFSQADGSTTRRYGGTGLGLTVSSTLVGLMGGRIWVESEPDAGATFHFTAAFPIASLGTPVVADEPRLAGLRVLVVDDNPVNGRILMEQSTRWRMKPTEVDGAPASGSINRETLMERLGDDQQLLRQVIILFLEDCPPPRRDPRRCCGRRRRAGALRGARAQGQRRLSPPTDSSKRPASSRRPAARAEWPMPPWRCTVCSMKLRPR